MSRHVQRRTLAVATVMALLAGYAAFGPAGVASAASLTGSTFEIESDADLVASGGLDWADGSHLLAGVLAQPDQPSGSSDDSFTQGTHEDTDVPTTDAGSIPPHKSDLKDFGLYVEKAGAGVFLNVFWTRVQDPSGDTNMDFEFNQSQVMNNDPIGSAQVIPVRLPGDLLLTYDLSNGGAVATVSKRFWGGSSWGAATALTNTQAIAGINSSAITAANAGGLGSLSARTFGEASVDLLALLPPDQGCKTYGSVYLKSRSSDSFSSELKDFIAPKSASVSNCGAIKVHKTGGNGTALAGAGFTLYKDLAPIGGSRGAEDTLVATKSTDASGDLTFEDVKKGDYWVVESTIPAGHDGVSDQHVSITAGDEVVSLALDDPVQTGTITVTKDAVPNDGQDFTFSLDSTDFALDDDADPALPNTRSFTVPVGSHSLQETSIPAGWTLTGLSCTGAGVTTASATASITLAKDATVHCTYTDSFTAVGVSLSTTAVSAGGGAWNDNASLTGDGTHAVTGNVAFFACAPSAVATACSTGGTAVGSAVAVSHVSGSAYAASTSSSYSPPSAGWTCFRAEFTSTSAFYTSSKHTNATTECFSRQLADLTVTKTATPAFGRAYQWTISKDVDASKVTIASGGKVTSHYTVVVGNTHTDNAWTVTGSITVTNPNPVAFTGVAVTDAIDNGASCVVTGGASATVPANDVKVLGYTCTYSSAPTAAAGTNTATAAWDAAAFFTPHGTAAGTATVDFSKATPSVTDDVVGVTDSVKGSLGSGNALTDANPKTFTYSVERSGVAGTCTTYPNTATFTTDDRATTGSASQSVEICVGADLTASPSGSGSKARDDLWALQKDVDKTQASIAQGGTAVFSYQVTVTPNGFVDSAFALGGSVHVANPNDFEAVTANVTLGSDVGGGVSCTVTGGSAVSVPASGAVNLPYTCTFTGSPASTGNVTATVTWDAAAAGTPHGSAAGSSAVSFATNGETHSTVTVVDDKTDPANPVVLGTASWSGGPKAFTYSLGKQGVAGGCASYNNTAVISETGQSASKSVGVCVGADLGVSASAVGSFARDDLWTIAKAVDRTRVTAADGTVVTFNYTVTASPDGFLDSGYALGGVVTVTNPNTWEAVTTDVAVSTDLSAGATCTVANGSAQTVAAGGSLALTYTCAFPDAPARTGNVTATATWDQLAASTPNGSSAGTAPASLDQASESDTTVTVVDDKTDPAHPVVLGTATWADGPAAFTYGLDKTAAGTTCTTYTNVATLRETGQSSSQDVAVCGQFTGGGGTITQPTKGGGTLTFTGAYTAVMAEWALAGLAAGLLLLLVGRRRRS